MYVCILNSFCIFTLMCLVEPGEKREKNYLTFRNMCGHMNSIQCITLVSSNCKCKNTEVCLSTQTCSYLTHKGTAHLLWWLSACCHAFHWLVTIEGHDNNLTLRNSWLFDTLTFHKDFYEERCVFSYWKMQFVVYVRKVCL